MQKKIENKKLNNEDKFKMFDVIIICIVVLINLLAPVIILLGSIFLMYEFRWNILNWLKNYFNLPVSINTIIEEMLEV